MTSPDHDARFMAAAVRLGRRGQGRVAPNPAVGCLIVRHDGAVAEIVGRGWTKPGGRPHAEAVALAEAGQRARGATVYVTLEPCAHDGRAGPCADALIEAGIARLVTAITDPDPRTAGAGHARLAAAGVAVEEGVAAAEARFDLLGHILRMTRGRPFVQLKLAHSRDGFIAGRGRAGVRITGTAADGWVHRMRAQADAILIGAGTARADDPLLTCRLPGAAGRSPLRVVLDAAASLAPASRLASSARELPVLVFAGEAAAPARAAALRALGVEIETVAGDDAGRVDIGAALAFLARRGVTRLMVEGGGEIARAFLSQGLVDEIVMIEGAMEIGPGGYPAFASDGPAFVAACGDMPLVETFALGDDRVRRYARKD